MKKQSGAIDKGYSRFNSNKRLVSKYDAYLPKGEGVKKLIRFAISFTMTTQLSKSDDSHKKNRDQGYYSNWKNYHLIFKDPPLYLGRLPTEDIIEDILHLFPQSISKNQTLGRGLVVSCNEHFELAGKGALYQKIYSPHFWSELGICHHQVIFPDFTTEVADAFILDALRLMKEYHDKGIPIYIHCKAGRARSAMLAALHLIQTQPEKFVVVTSGKGVNIAKTFNNAVGYIKRSRHYINVKGKTSKAEQILKENFYYHRNKESYIFTDPYEKQRRNCQIKFHSSDVRRYLCSDHFKSLVFQLPSYKQLMLYLKQQCGDGSKRLKTIHDFFKKVSHSSAGWYEELTEVCEGGASNSELFHFCNANPWKESLFNKKTANNNFRFKLLRGIKEDVDRIVIARFNFFQNTHNLNIWCDQDPKMAAPMIRGYIRRNIEQMTAKELLTMANAHHLCLPLFIRCGKKFLNILREVPPKNSELIHLLSIARECESFGCIILQTPELFAAIAEDELGLNRWVMLSHSSKPIKDALTAAQRQQCPSATEPKIIQVRKL